MQMENEEPRKKKTMRIEVTPKSSGLGKDKGKAILVNGLPVPRMEPGEEVLSVELFPRKTRMVTNIGAKMELEVQRHVTECIRRNTYVFAFKPTNLKGIDPKMALHRLHEDPSIKPVKQKLRMFEKENDKIIQEEVQKLLEALHITMIQFFI